MKNALVFVAAWALLAIDRWLKQTAMERFFLHHQENFFIVKPWFSLSFYANDHLAFSLPLPLSIVIPISIFVILILFFLVLKSATEKNWGLATGLFVIFLGALSNLFDRLTFGYVIDFLRLEPVSYFNLADMLIAAGVLWLIWNQGLGKNRCCRQK